MFQLNFVGNQIEYLVENILFLGLGVYIVDQMNESFFREVLDLIDWYVGNIFFSLDYVYRVYNDILKVVKNLIEILKLIIEKFFGVFKIGIDNNEI